MESVANLKGWIKENGWGVLVKVTRKYYGPLGKISVIEASAKSQAYKKYHYRRDEIMSKPSKDCTAEEETFRLVKGKRP